MKWVLRILMVLIGLVLLFALFIQFAGNKTFDIPIPENIQASDDPEIIARGEYLVNGPAHCTGCHVPMDKMRDIDQGKMHPMVGGFTMDIPPAKIVSPNITPDPETGIGNISDGQLARAIRSGVKSDGKLLFPVMNYPNMSDEDVTAIISYLRSLEPVRYEQEKSEYKFLGKMLIAMGVLKPIDTGLVPPASVERGPTAAYGEYFARNIGNCMACHTKMDMKTGEFIKPDFSGGTYFAPDEFSGGYAYVSPNLTPHPTTGIMTNWSEEQFISRFKQGRIHEGSHMPWGMFTRIDSVDLKAMYAFFQSLDPVEHEIEEIVIAPSNVAME